MDWDLFNAARGAVIVASTLQNTLSSLITRELFDGDKEDQQEPVTLVHHGEVPTVW